MLAFQISDFGQVQAVERHLSLNGLLKSKGVVRVCPELYDVLELVEVGLEDIVGIEQLASEEGVGIDWPLTE